MTVRGFFFLVVKDTNMRLWSRGYFANIYDKMVSRPSDLFLNLLTCWSFTPEEKVLLEYLRVIVSVVGQSLLHWPGCAPSAERREGRVCGDQL